MLEHGRKVYGASESLLADDSLNNIQAANHFLQSSDQ